MKNDTKNKIKYPGKLCNQLQQLKSINNTIAVSYETQH